MTEAAHKSPDDRQTSETTPAVLLSWQEAVGVLRKHRGLIMQVTLIGVALFSLLVLLTPPKYRSSAMLMVRQNVAQVPVSPGDGVDAVSSRDTDFRSVEPDLNAAVAVLQSTALIREVLSGNAGARTEPESAAIVQFVKRLKDATVGSVARLYRSLHGVPKPEAVEAAVAKTRRDLSVAAVPKSNLLEVSFVHENREWSAGFVNELMNAYLKPDKDKKGAPADDRLGFFSAQRERLEDELRAAEAALANFRDRAGEDLSYETEQTVTARRSRLQTMLVDATAEHARATAHGQKLAYELRKLPSQAAQRAELEFVGARTDRYALAAKIEKLQEQIAIETERLQRLDTVKAQRKSLESRVDVASRAYEMYAKKEEEARFAQAVDRANLVNYSVVRAAEVPLATEPTNNRLILLLGTILSLCAGIALAVVKDLTQSRSEYAVAAADPPAAVASADERQAVRQV